MYSLTEKQLIALIHDLLETREHQAEELNNSDYSRETQRLNYLWKELHIACDNKPNMPASFDSVLRSIAREI